MHQHHCPCKKDTKTRSIYFLPQLKKLVRSGNNKELLDEVCANDCFLRFIIDIAGGVLRGDITLPHHKYKKLRQFKNQLLLLVRKRHPFKKKKALLLEQKGGAFPVLLGLLGQLALPVISTAISSLIK